MCRLWHKIFVLRTHGNTVGTRTAHYEGRRVSVFTVLPALDEFEEDFGHSLGPITAIFRSSRTHHRQGAIWATLESVLMQCPDY